MSDPDCNADSMQNSSKISITGMTNEAMTVKSSLMFLYGDTYKSNLITTIMVEVHAR